MSDFKLLLDLNSYHLKNITDKVIEKLKGFSGVEFCSSGDDSGLTNIWEEICVQIQSEYSFQWQSYDNTIDNVITLIFEESPLAVKRLISYIQSVDESSSDQQEPFNYREDWALKAIKQKVMKIAGEYENEAIKKNLYGPNEEMEDDDEE